MMDQDEPPPADFGDQEPLRPKVSFYGCEIHPASNGWIITRKQSLIPIVIEQQDGRDNVARLLARLSVILGDTE